MTSRPSIGIFLGRPDRGARLAAGLRRRGFDVVHYNQVGFDGEPYVAVQYGALRAAAYVVLRTRHDAYLTGLSHVPGLSLYMNHALRRKPYVFNETSLNWTSFTDRSRGRPFPRLFEHVVHPFLLGRQYAGAERIVCNSRYLCERISARYPRCRDRLAAIYNGIDPSGRTFTRPSRRRDVVLACVTTLNFANKSAGVSLVLDAFDKVAAKRSDVRLVIAAKCSHLIYLRRLKGALAERPWRDQVEVHANHPRIGELLARSDLFVYATPDEAESLPRALLEAQAAGLPAVATSTCGCPEIVGHGETGLLVAYDAERFAESMLALIDDPARRAQMGARAREHIAEVFSWEAMAAGYAQLFKEIAR